MQTLVTLIVCGKTILYGDSDLVFDTVPSSRSADPIRILANERQRRHVPSRSLL